MCRIAATSSADRLTVADALEPRLPEVLDVLLQFVVLVIEFQSALHPDLASSSDDGLCTDGDHSVESVVVEDFTNGGDLQFAECNYSAKCAFL